MAHSTARHRSVGLLVALAVPAAFAAGCSSSFGTGAGGGKSQLGDAAAGASSTGGAASGGASAGGAGAGGASAGGKKGSGGAAAGGYVGSGGASAGGGPSGGGGSNGGASAGGASSGGASAGGASAGGASAGGASAGGNVGSGGGTGTVCSANADCKLVDDYCTGCDCRALGKGESLPHCSGPGVSCFVAPCAGKTAACVSGRCVAQAPGATCGLQGDTCASGEACCSGLSCCSGVPVPAGSEYCSNSCPRSDRNIKSGFASIERDQILESVASLPISRWSYLTEGAHITHLGPMAQDFKAAFGLGDSDKTILQVDADGVALVAIQALNARVEKLAAENAALKARVDALGGTARSKR